MIALGHKQPSAPMAGSAEKLSRLVFKLESIFRIILEGHKYLRMKMMGEEQE